MTTARALTGCLTGTAVGDALGLPYENISPRRARRLYPDGDRYHFLFGRGMFSDDTEHACMTAQALLASGGEPTRFVRSLAWRLRWWLVGCPPAVGLATLKACLKLWLGVSPNRSGVFSAGNGPCMRAPILGVAAGSRASLRELIRRSTRLTHTDPKAEYAALAVALAAHLSATEPTLPPVETAERIVDGLPASTSELAQLLRKAASAVGLETEAFAADLGLGRGVTGYVYHTVPVVFHAWLRHPDDYPAAIGAALRCGGDTDTTAAILGGIVGARVGVEGIPARWRAGIAEWPRNLRWIARLGRELAAGLAENAPRRTVPLNPAGLLARNMVFTGTVFAHVFRRLLPPYRRPKWSSPIPGQCASISRPLYEPGTPMPVELRFLEQRDFEKGFLETLANLAQVNLTPDEAIHIWRGRNAAGVRTVVAVDDNRVIGTASLILEHKFLHHGGTIGHIEDVAVHPQAQGKGIGTKVVQFLVEMARQSGCYKVILSCTDQNTAFYTRLGFRRHDNGMRLDLTQ